MYALLIFRNTVDGDEASGDDVTDESGASHVSQLSAIGDDVTHVESLR